MQYVPKHFRKPFFNGFNGWKLMVCNVSNGICNGISVMVSIFQQGCFIINQYQWNNCIDNKKRKQYTETFIFMFFITDLDNDIINFLVFGLSLEMFHCSLRNFCNIDSYSTKLNHCWTHLIWIMAALYLDRICFIIDELYNLDTATELNRINIEMTSIMTIVFNRAVLVEIEVTLYLLTFYNTDIFFSVKQSELDKALYE